MIVDQQANVIFVFYNPNTHFEHAVLRKAAEEAETTFPLIQIVARGRIVEEGAKHFLVAGEDRFLLIEPPASAPPLPDPSDTVLSVIASVLTLFGMFVFRRFMAERSIAYIIVVLTLAGTLLATPFIGMYYGLHEWTAARTGGMVDARFIALVDTALESPLGQIAMIPMLAWIANSAPSNLKATYFAVMASFANLALSASQLGTKYLNQIFVVTREVRDQATGAVKVPADYSEVGFLLLGATAIGLALPLAAVAVMRALRLRTA